MTTHRCPGPGCGRQVPVHMLACRNHWHSVPKPLRDAVRAAWRDGEGAGSPEHEAAMDAAIAAMRHRERLS